jgi:hypothetical protein
VLLPAAALEEESVIDSQFDRVQYLGENFGDVLRRLRVSLLRYRKEAQLLRLATGDIEKLSFELPRMLLSPKTSYKWNTKVTPRTRRLVPVAVAAVVHTVILAMLPLASVRIRSAAEEPPRINVSFRPARQEEQFLELELKQPETIPEPVHLAKDEATLTREEAAMEMLIKALGRKPSGVPGEVSAVEDAAFAGSELMKELLEELRDSVPIASKGGTARAPQPGGEWESKSGPAAGAAASKDEVDKEWLERTRRWRKEAHRKLKEKIERVTVLTECFAAIKDIAYDKSSSFFSLPDAQNYVRNRFLEEMADRVAGKCGVDREKVLSIWEGRETAHPKTIHLGVSGTRLVAAGTCDWLRTHPVIRKRVVEYLIATNHCEIRKVYKEPCWRCAGKGYLIKTTTRSPAPGFTFYRVPCPICAGLGYELVIVYE